MAARSKLKLTKATCARPNNFNTGGSADFSQPQGALVTGSHLGCATWIAALQTASY